MPAASYPSWELKYRKIFRKNYRIQKLIEAKQTRLFPKDNWSKSKSRAKKLNLEFSINRDDFLIPMYCPAIGIKLDWSDLNHTPVLDRIDNKKGYVKGNVIVVSMKVNTIKRNLTVEQLKQMGDFYASSLL